MEMKRYLLEQASAALDEFFRYANAVPADRMNWEPDGGRSVLSQAREVARTPKWSADAIRARELKFEDEAMAADYEIQSTLGDIAACQSHAQSNMDDLKAVVDGLSEEELQSRIASVIGADGTQALQDMLEMVRWNATYHTGQVAYVQTMYGDKKMY